LALAAAELAESEVCPRQGTSLLQRRFERSPAPTAPHDEMEMDAEGVVEQERVVSLHPPAVWSVPEGSAAATAPLLLPSSPLSLLSEASATVEALASRLLGAGTLRVEMHLVPEVGTLHQGPFGPMPMFVRKVRAAVCEALDVPLRRLQPLGVRGAWIDMNLAQLQEEMPYRLVEEANVNGTLNETTGQGTLTTDHGTILDFEVLQGASATDPTPPQIARTWRSQLSDEGSPLRSTILGEILAGATLRVPADTNHVLDSRGVPAVGGQATLITLAFVALVGLRSAWLVESAL